MQRRLEWETQATTQDAMGQPNYTWSAVATRYASVEPLSGRELMAASGEHADVTVRIRARYDATLRTVKPADRILDPTYSPAAVYDIQWIQNIGERNREVVFMCRRNG